jgi:hypothetical protein
MTERATKPEGWYSDPLDQADLRWWDGRNWTEDVKSPRARSTAPKSEEPLPGLQWAEDFDRLLEPQSRPVHQPPPPAPRPVAPPQRELFATSAGEPRPQVPTGPDWSELAAAVLTAGDAIVTATATGIPELTIDIFGRTYWWSTELDSFPAHPVDLRVVTTPRTAARLPATAGRDTEPLLWRIGTGSFAPALLRRVDASLRYKLRRWPNLAAMPHSADQSRLTTMLANAQLTSTELSAVTDVPQREVDVLISTFALMSLLDIVPDPAVAARAGR